MTALYLEPDTRCASQLCNLQFLWPGCCRNGRGMLIIHNTLRMRNNFIFSCRSQSQLKSLRFLLIIYSFSFYSFFYFSTHWRIYATLWESPLPFPEAKQAPVKFVLAEFAGIFCIVLTKYFCSLLGGFQKQVLMQGQLTNLLYNKAYNDHGKG